jgi:ribosomal protein L11
MPEPKVSVEVVSQEQPPAEDPSPTVVIVEDSSEPAAGSAEESAIGATIEHEGDIARLEMLVAQQAEEIAALKEAALVNAEASQAAVDIAGEAVSIAVQAEEGAQPEAESDDEPDREHWFYRKARK